MSDKPLADNAEGSEASSDQAKRYARRRYVLFFAHLAVGVAFLAAMIAGGSPALARWAREMAGLDRFLTVLFFYFAAFSLVYLAVTLPLTFYGEYALEHEFGLSTQTLGRWAARRLKKWAFSFAVAAPLVLGFYWIIRRWPERWWLPAAVAWLLVSYVFARLAPRVVLPLFYKLQLIGDEALAARLAALASKAGIRLTGACRIDLSRETRKANAAVIGLGSSRRVVLGDTLLEKFTQDEIASVFAHELGHIVHGDLAKGFVLAAALATGSLYAGSLVLARAAAALGIAAVGPDPASRAANPETLPILIAIFAVIQLGVMPFEKWYSRWREQKSDEYALRATGDRESFILAMKKLGAMNLADVNPSRLAEIFLFSHPPISRRIQFARRLNLDAPR